MVFDSYLLIAAVIAGSTCHSVWTSPRTASGGIIDAFYT